MYLEEETHAPPAVTTTPSSHSPISPSPVAVSDGEPSSSAVIEEAPESHEGFNPSNATEASTAKQESAESAGNDVAMEENNVNVPKDPNSVVAEPEVDGSAEENDANVPNSVGESAKGPNNDTVEKEPIDAGSNQKLGQFSDIGQTSTKI
jgi:hypothetical protein